jgi:hypothetical protein
MRVWSESWADEPVVHWPDLPAELEEALPEAVERARSDMNPGDPAEVLAALTSMATRRGFPLPDEAALMMDVRVMAAWPADLFVKAFRLVWENFRYRRLPEVGDFRVHIEDDLRERLTVLQRLEGFRMKLETRRMQERWDREARERRSAKQSNHRQDGGKPSEKGKNGDAVAGPPSHTNRRAQCHPNLRLLEPVSDVPDAAVDVRGRLHDVLHGLGEAQDHVGLAHAALDPAVPGLDAALLAIVAKDVPVQLADEAHVVERTELHLELGRSGEAVDRRAGSGNLNIGISGVSA